MYLSRIKISKFRNFSDLDVPLSGNVVIVGENRVGKSNLLYALRLIFDPSLPDSDRLLGLADFWDGLEAGPSATDKIVISVEILDFENDEDVLAVLTDYRLDHDPHTVRLTYEFRPKAELEGAPSTDDDFEFICYGGESESKRFSHDLRRRIPMDLLPALRDAEGDLATWRRSPLRPLIENAVKGIDQKNLTEICNAVHVASTKITEFDEVSNLEKEIAKLFAEMSGPKHDIEPRLGFSPTDPTRLYRNIRLLIDGGLRGISEASLGTANLVFLSLKALELKQLISQNSRDHTLLAIEEPEAHLHPHLQRSVYRHLFTGVSDREEESDKPLSILLTTHSPHIASVVPLHSLVLLRDGGKNGTQGYSTAELKFTDDERDDLSRYLDVTRAEMLFARGVILVEGDAERFLVPTFATKLKTPLDTQGITVCSVAGTNFVPYAKLLAGLEIPFAIMTDWDPRGDNKDPLGRNRALTLVAAIEEIRTGEKPTKLIAELKELKDMGEFKKRCDECGILMNFHTLEVDLFNQDENFRKAVIATLREGPFGAERLGQIDQWEKEPAKLDTDKFLTLVEQMGKGRFAQRLRKRIADCAPPNYIAKAIKFVADRV